MSMTLFKAIKKQLATDTNTTIIRADQTGVVPQKPYATYKIISHRKGTGQEDISHRDEPDALIEKRVEERNATISFNVYGTTHDNAYEVAEKLRKWFVYGGSFYLDEMNAAVVEVSDVQNRTTFLVDSYDEKYGFDVIIRYLDIDEREADYFDTVEYYVQINSDTKKYPPKKYIAKIGE